MTFQRSAALHPGQVMSLKRIDEKGLDNGLNHTPAFAKGYGGQSTHIPKHTPKADTESRQSTPDRGP